jgi:hypothetical protein
VLQSEVPLRKSKTYASLDTVARSKAKLKNDSSLPATNSYAYDVVCSITTYMHLLVESSEQIFFLFRHVL